VQGVDALDGLDPFTRGTLPVSISLGRDLGRRDTDGVRYVLDRLPPTDRRQRYGLVVTTPLGTAFDGARWASDLAEAVVVLDLRSPSVLAERLRARHHQGLRRDRRQDRWTLEAPAWWRRPAS
jgi:hypothetical protein